MKPLKRKNYGSIPHLSNSKLGISDSYISEGQEKILTKKKRDKYDTILVFEKYDGSNVGICKTNNKIFAITRNGMLANTSPHRQHRIFADYVKTKQNLFSELLKNGERLVGEWLLLAHGLRYKITPIDPILFFDFFDSNNNRKTFNILESTGLQTPRLLHKGDAISVDNLIPVLNEKTQSFKSLEKPEGMVYRVERKNKVDFLAKWVRSDFVAGKYFNQNIYNF